MNIMPIYKKNEKKKRNQNSRNHLRTSSIVKKKNGELILFVAFIYKNIRLYKKK